MCSESQFKDLNSVMTYNQKLKLLVLRDSNVGLQKPKNNFSNSWDLMTIKVKLSNFGYNRRYSKLNTRGDTIKRH